MRDAWQMHDKCLFTFFLPIVYLRDQLKVIGKPKTMIFIHALIIYLANI